MVCTFFLIFYISHHGFSFRLFLCSSFFTWQIIWLDSGFARFIKWCWLCSANSWVLIIILELLSLTESWLLNAMKWFFQQLLIFYAFCILENTYWPATCVNYFEGADDWDAFLSASTDLISWWVIVGESWHRLEDQLISEICYCGGWHQKYLVSFKLICFLLLHR